MRRIASETFRVQFCLYQSLFILNYFSFRCRIRNYFSFRCRIRSCTYNLSGYFDVLNMVRNPGLQKIWLLYNLQCSACACRKIQIGIDLKSLQNRMTTVHQTFLKSSLHLQASYYSRVISSGDLNLKLVPIGKQLIYSRNFSDKNMEEMESWEMLVNYDRLTPLEIKNHERHVKACKEQQEFYTDVATGYQVLSRYAHLKRGECCGNACRHCPFGQKNVPPELKKTKTFNSAYYA